MNSTADKKIMQRIKLEQAKAGMILGKKVENQKGMALCNEGTELSDSILLRFENSKITHITVQGHPVKMESDKPFSQMIQELNHRFQKVVEIPQMKEVRDILECQLKNRFGEEDPAGNPDEDTERGRDTDN